MQANYKTILKTSALALAAAGSLGWASLSVAQQPGPPPGPGMDHREEHRDERGPDRHYEFRDADREKLRQHYNGDLKRVDRGHRPDFREGQPVPADYRGRIKPVPQSVRRDLPPPPKGYQMGYYDGYTVVYDPVSFTILQVLDILR
ncbi:hypothetical protein [Herbaspirillum robiniae]|uniref:Transmembrane signal peptide protein n=1 Tax=Herbaspirillum robiniae TaxID=2014887 RepID=A0A246WVJ9_9BURK|nr:hypothetical protein [Herbaspirillum robiniae]NUU01262.1 hypothetical protein [Herbaspirillum robiniae]OWY30711.1 hypothetical protein CEJ42_01125 [Herbaspirillum robiniae]